MTETDPARTGVSKINSPVISSETINAVEEQRVAHAEARARLAEQIQDMAAELHRLRAELKRTVVAGHRLGIHKSGLSQLVGSTRPTINRWLAEADTDRTPTRERVPDDSAAGSSTPRSSTLGKGAA